MIYNKNSNAAQAGIVKHVHSDLNYFRFVCTKCIYITLSSKDIDIIAAAAKQHKHTSSPFLVPDYDSLAEWAKEFKAEVILELPDEYFT